MAKKDHKISEVITNEATKVVEKASPYKGKSIDELLDLLEKKDNLLSGYESDISKLRRQVEECTAEYDELAEKSKDVIAKYNDLEASQKAELAELEKAHKAELEKQKDAFDAMIAGQTEADAKKLKSLKDSYEEELREANETADATIADLEAQVRELSKENKHLKKEATTFATKIDDLTLAKTKAEQMIRDGLRYDALIAAEEDASVKEVEELRKELNSKIDMYIEESRQNRTKRFEAAKREIADEIAAKEQAAKDAEELRRLKENYAALERIIEAKENGEA